MKRILIIFLLGSGVFFHSCRKALETSPSDFVSPETSFNTEADLTRALNGVYNRLVPLYGRYFVTIHAVTDEFFFKSILSSNIKVMDITAANADVESLWAIIYQGIDRANLVIANAGRPAMDEARRTIMKGEAYFLRGYYYYLLVYNFGSVPVRLTPTQSPDEDPVASSSIRDVYEQVVSDMKMAESMVAPITDFSYNERISKTAVQAILARVYLSMAGAPLNDLDKYEDASAYATSVISSGLHSLNPDYKQIFINHAQDKYDLRECIWETGIYGNQTGTVQLAGKLGIENGIQSRDNDIGYGIGDMHITPRIYNFYDQNDLRRDWNIATYMYNTNASGVTTTVNFGPTQIYDRNIGKWRREYELSLPKAMSWNATNCPMIRYSDVLLMKAEAENFISGPTAEIYELVNQVRRRGYGKPVNIPDPVADLPAGLDKIAFQKAIEEERAREFAFEGLRKIDLLRWNKYVSSMQSLADEITSTAPSTWQTAATAARNISDRNRFFPIPAAELRTNPLARQNPGW